MREEEEIRRILEKMDTVKAPEGFHTRLMNRIADIEKEKLPVFEPLIKKGTWIKGAIVMLLLVIALLISNISMAVKLDWLLEYLPSNIAIPQVPWAELAFVLVPLTLLFIDALHKRMGNTAWQQG